MGALITGDMVRFQTPHESDITHLRVYFTPQQAGSGTPSPTNVRPITGWDGIDVWRTGKNIVHATGYSATTTYGRSSNNYGTTLSTTTYDPDGELVVTQSSYNAEYTLWHFYNGYFVVMNDNLVFGKTYEIAFRITDIINNPLNAALSDIRLSDQSGTGEMPYLIDGDILHYRKQYKINPSNPTQRYIQINNCGMSFTFSDFIVTPVDETDLSFQYYEGSSITTDWSSTAGTLYGGYVDLVTGELTATWWGVTAKVSDCTIIATDDESGLSDYKYTIQNIKLLRNSSQMCNITTYKWETFAYTQPHFYGGYVSSDDTSAIYLFLPSNIDTSTEFTVVSQLQEPVVYTLSTQTLKTFVGVNNIWCNADHVEVEYNVIETCDIQAARRRILIAAPHVETVSNGNTVDSATIAHFKTDVPSNVKQLKVEFTPVLNGTGTPSPTNVMPITGWDGITITRCGVNLLECDSFSNGTRQNIVYTGQKTNGQITSITMKGTTSQANAFSNLNYHSNMMMIGQNRYATNAYSNQANIVLNVHGVVGIPEGQTSYVPTSAGWVRYDFRSTEVAPTSWARIQVYPYQADTVVDTVVYPLVCLASDEGTAFEPYNGIDITASWSSIAGTAYSGYVDVLTGDLVITHKLVTMTGSESNGQWGWDSYCIPNVPGVISDNGTYKGVAACSHTNVLTAGYVVWQSSSGVGGSGYDNCAATSQGRNVRYRDRNNMTDLASAQAYLQGQYNNGTPVQLVCKLEEPVHYSITPLTLKTLRGINNVWSNSNGNITVSYWTH